MSGVQELSGTTLKGYQLIDCLGWTSHTAVYRAQRAGNLWAVKILDGQLAPDGSLAERLRREAHLLADIDNPSILPIQDAGRSGRMTYAVSPLVRGQTLRDVMGRGRLPNEQAWTILSRLADTLDSVHYRGLVFRLLKPAHVLVDDDNVYLAEFGVAGDRLGPLAMATPAYRLTAPQYLAPEQVEGREPDWRADIYALAVLVFEILTGTPLHAQGQASEVMQATLNGAPPSAREREPGLPRSLDAVLGRAMAPNPEHRHRSAWELLQELVTLPDDQPVAAIRTGRAAVGQGSDGAGSTALAVREPAEKKGTNKKK